MSEDQRVSRNAQEPEKTGRAPIAVSIDLMDEDHSLTLALKRLIADQTLRAQLGAAAEAYWRANHTVEHMVEDYERLLSAPAPSGLATGRGDRASAAPSA